MLLKLNQIAIIRTDTLYGLVARISDKEAVEKVYQLKSRDFTKQCIVLVPNKEAIGVHGYLVDDISKNYNGAVTVVVPKTSEPEWITRGGDTVAYRIPKSKELQELLLETGPLIAPSANPQGFPPARTIAEAKAYFGDRVDIYKDSGEVPVEMLPSTLIEVMENGEQVVLR